VAGVVNKATLRAVLRAIAAGEISRTDAAERLGVSERTVNRKMKEAEVERPPSPAHAARAAAASRRAERKENAAGVRDGELTPEQAAENADVHVRTIYRWLNRLEMAEKAKNTRKTTQKRGKRTRND
jgi:transposase